MENPKIYSEAYYARLYEVEERQWWCRGMRAAGEALLRPQLADSANWTVLDAGCGSGVAVEWLRRLGVGSRYAAFDLSPHALAFCRSRGQGGLCLASVLELPYKDGVFDLITCLDVLQHLPRPEGDLAALRECRRTLKPGGLMLMRSNALRSADVGEGEEADYQRYTLEGLRSVFEAAGLEIVRLTLVNSFDALRERFAPPKARGIKTKCQSDHGLPLRLMPPWLGWLNYSLYLYLKAEAAWLAKPGRVLRTGHSSIVLARRAG